MVRKDGITRMSEEKNENRDVTSFKEAPFLAIKGFLMGSADIVPGVSGGTMALILDIYERLLNAIKSADTVFIKNLLTFKWRVAFTQLHVFFLGTLFFGIFSAAAFFTKVVPLQIYMFTHPEIVYGLFFGLILGSIYILIKTLDGFGLKETVSLVLGVAFGLWIVSLVPTDTPDHPAFVFLTGMIAISAMILPGISGSYLLLIMRKYDFLLSNISMIGGEDTLTAIINILPFTLGSIVGIALFSRFLSWLLGKYHAQTISVLIGFLIGSLFVIWPFQHRDFVEKVGDVETVSISSERVQNLQQGIDENLPEFEKLGDQVSESTIEIKTIKKKLIKSTPYIPGSIGSTGEETPNVWGGIAGMIIGIVLVGGLDQLRKVKE